MQSIRSFIEHTLKPPNRRFFDPNLETLVKGQQTINLPSAAHTVDTSLAWEPVAYGQSGWDYVNGIARFVVLDFDTQDDHPNNRHATTTDQLDKVASFLSSLPFVDLNRSTSGKGYHARIQLDCPSCKSREEYQSLRRRVVAHLDSLGNGIVSQTMDKGARILWLWREDATGFQPLAESTDQLSAQSLPEPERSAPTERLEFNLSEVKDALYSLPRPYADTYDDWIAVGQCLYHTDPDLLWLWREWSQLSDKYAQGACENKWHSFATEGKKRTVATLFHLAKQEGWRFPDTKTKNRTDGTITYETIPTSELTMNSFTVNWLIDGILAAQQPCLIGGPQKTLKTSIGVDAAISIATGTNFLGRYPAKQTKTLMMSGESGLGVLQETMRRVCKSKGINPLDVGDQLLWSVKLPRFGRPEYIDPLAALLDEKQIKCLLIDPVYLCMDGTDAGNLMKQGELLATIGDVCADQGVTLLLFHHATKESAKSTAPPKLTDFAWAGFAEFARQWWILKRRTPYMEGTGRHDLWMTVGGSAGHSEFLCLDIREGRLADDGGRVWAVDVQSASQARREDEQTQIETQCESVIGALEAHGQLTQTQLIELAGISRRGWNTLKPHLAERLTITTGAGNKKLYSLN